MPEKEGAEEKTTKSVVNKRQKQMMNKEEYTIEMVRKIKKKISARAVFPTVAQNKVKGEIVKGDDLKIDNKNPVKKKMQKNNLDEEGYDIARDMGRVPKTKDKKDATSYPPSEEMKKLRKVNKGPSALERVKADIKKRGEKIMDVKKEELDLTKVAEAFGGYIIEAEVTGNTSGKNKGGGARSGRKPKDYLSGRISLLGNMATNKEIEDASADQTNQDYSKNNTKENRRKVEVTYGKGRRGDRITGNVEPEPKKIKKPIRDRNRVLQRVRIAARTAKRPVQRLVKPTPGLLAKAGKVAIKNPFATLVGASFAKDTFFPVKLPRPPVVRGGKVGRRTAG